MEPPHGARERQLGSLAVPVSSGCCPAWRPPSAARCAPACGRGEQTRADLGERQLGSLAVRLFEVWHASGRVSMGDVARWQRGPGSELSAPVAADRTECRQLAMSADARMHTKKNDQMRLLYDLLGHVCMHGCACLLRHPAHMLQWHGRAAALRGRARGAAADRMYHPPAQQRHLQHVRRPDPHVLRAAAVLRLLDGGRHLLCRCGLQVRARTPSVSLHARGLPQSNALATPCCLR